MANSEFVDLIKKKGISDWNSWRQNLDDQAYRQLTPFNLTNIDFEGAWIHDADLSTANLSGANFEHSHLTKIDFSHSASDKASFYDAELLDCNFSHSDLSKNDFTDARFRRCKVIGQGAFEANFKDATLQDVDFIGGRFQNCSFSEATFKSCFFEKVDFYNSSFKKSYMLENIFYNCDFTQTSFLDEARGLPTNAMDQEYMTKSIHLFPKSFLSLFFKSTREMLAASLFNPYLSIKEITDILYQLTAMNSERPFEYYSCFISYSAKDEKFAEKLYADLKKEHVNCWFAKESLKIGDIIRPTIDQAIRENDKLLVIMSKNSIDSPWVKDEVESAIEEKGISKRKILFPIMIDSTALKTRTDWGARIKRQIHIGDFTKPYLYEKKFEKLLEDLRSR
jgi:uncharacterized protein YjbI with pentapeptide repeats